MAWRRGGRDGGSVSLEMAILGPGFLVFIAALVFGGRVAVAGQAVDQAASEAARTASVARGKVEADSTAKAAAQVTLQQQGLQCQNLNVEVDTSGFARPVGTPASVSVVVTCDVRLGDLSPALTISRTVTGSASSPLDTYRQR
jgi:Flp pilus assembly protein TadG